MDEVPTRPGVPMGPIPKDANGDFRHCQGILLDFFDERRAFEPFAFLYPVHGDKQLPKFKARGILKGMAFAEMPLEPAECR